MDEREPLTLECYLLHSASVSKAGAVPVLDCMCE